MIHAFAVFNIIVPGFRLIGHVERLHTSRAAQHVDWALEHVAHARRHCVELAADAMQDALCQD